MSPTARRGWLQVVFLVSGAPGLIAQLGWSRVFTAGLGHEMPAVAAVVSAFFVGLAAGAWGLDGAVSRSGCPARWYAGLELFAAGWVLALTPWLPGAMELTRGWIGLEPSAWREAAAAFALPLAVIGPAAAALGATLPAMERAVAPLLPDGRAVGGLYALNTAGAVGGIVAAIWFLMPAFGFRHTLWVAAAIQAGCGFAVLALAGRGGGAPSAATAGAAPPCRREPPIPPGSGLPAGGPTGGVRVGGWRLAVTALVTGLLGIGFELLGVRALAQTTENTIHTFGAALAVLLTGTAVGAALGRAALRRGREPGLDLLLGGLGFAGVGATVVVAASARLLEGIRGVAPGVGAEALLAAAVFLPPSILMGLTFPVVVHAARSRWGGIGRPVALNCLGSALAAPVVLGWLLPAAGLKGALASVALGYLALMPRAARRGCWILPLAAFGVLPLLPARLLLPELPAGATLVRHEEGRLATVAVVRTADGHRTLRVNNHFQQGGTGTAGAARRQAHLPLLLHPHPRRVLFLGVGTGVTLGAAAAHAGIAAEGVELLPGVVRALGEFEPENGAPQRDPAFRVVTADARRFIRAGSGRYDVIIADLFHPGEDGAGFLYTQEHFAAMRRRLAEGGLVCQWLPLHQLDRRSFDDITRTFLAVFPGASLWLLRSNVDVPVVGLVGGAGTIEVEASLLGRRLAEPGLAAALKPLALTEPVRVLGHCLADAASLRRWAEEGEVATDDRPLVLFRAPARGRGGAAASARRILDLAEAGEPAFAGWVAGPGRDELLPRLERFRTARDLHLKGLVEETEGRRREALDAFVASAEVSADYTAGYAQAVLVAAAFAQEDPALTRGVLQRLIRARPEQGLAAELLQRVGR